MKYKMISEGFIAKADKSKDLSFAGPRFVVMDNGEIICSYITSTGLGLNNQRVNISRSKDMGKTWISQGQIWKELEDQYGIYCSISRSAEEELFLFGFRTPIDKAGEAIWSDATQGLKQNELIWAKSVDRGMTWTQPVPIPMQIPGSAEAPGAMCITKEGRWFAPYSPYNTFDPDLNVQRNQVVVLDSNDQGKTWRHNSMLKFNNRDSGGAEAWVTELKDGRLLGAAWHIRFDEGEDYPNAYAMSLDGGETWQPTGSTEIFGQSIALTPLAGGKALLIYNQRMHGEPGVRLAVACPKPDEFGTESDDIIWKAETAVQGDSGGNASDWTDFSFGEPSAVILSDNSILLGLWCSQPSEAGIKYLRFRVKS